MKDNRSWAPTAAFLAIMAVGLCLSQHDAAADNEMNDKLLVDDFSATDGTSALGTTWQGFTDRVMGGKSDMEIQRRIDDHGPVLNMRGQVRLENRGGFIQARLPLDPGGSVFDAGAWQGIGLRVRGQPGPYYLHLRTRHNWMPWQYYRARIEVRPDWRDQFVSFDAFEGVSTSRALDVRALKSLAVVAYGEAFEADIDVARIELVNP
jgi:hypothetical protein